MFLSLKSSTAALALTKLLFSLSSDRFLFVLMEFCSEGPLTKSIGIATTDIAKRDKWIIDLARGLQHIHSVLVIHRDIKPDNLLIAVDSSGQQTVKYIDFGLAVELSDCESMIDDGKQVGTPSYMSPELDARQTYGLPTDLWSLGVVFLQASRRIHSCHDDLHAEMLVLPRCHTDVHRSVGNRFDIKRTAQFPQDDACF